MMQHGDEFEWLLSHLQHITSILEIGSYDGGSLLGFVKDCPNLKKIRSIDIEPRPGLKQHFVDLKAAGYDAELLGADSHTLPAIAWATTNGPYDFIYIDGDHDSPGVDLDWHNYHTLAPLIGFHDMDHPHHAVKDLWAKLKADGYRTEEKITSYMGTGLVYR